MGVAAEAGSGAAVADAAEAGGVASSVSGANVSGEPDVSGTSPIAGEPCVSESTAGFPAAGDGACVRSTGLAGSGGTFGR